MHHEGDRLLHASRRGGHAARTGRLAPLVLLGLALAGPAGAQEKPRWQADETEAMATLPVAEGAGLADARLSCAGHLWTLALVTEAPVAETRSDATLTVDGKSFASEAAAAGTLISVAVPHEAIEPIALGLRMAVSLAQPPAGSPGEAVFPLRGSQVAIRAIEERCTPPDMSDYDEVTFTPYSSYLNLVRELRSGDIESFRIATQAEPEIAAAMIELDGGRRLLFTRMCGSSWYYGISGCNITGFASTGPAASAEGSAGGGEEGAAGEEWHAVYDSEGVRLHHDPAAQADGWPDLVTLPLRGRGEARRWRWDDGFYGIVDLEAPAPVVEGEGLRGSIEP